MDPKNYRPISLLPLMSKALEGTVHEKTMEFRDKHNILLQISIRISKKPFYGLLSYLPDKISKGFDSGLFTRVILTDL